MTIRICAYIGTQENTAQENGVFVVYAHRECPVHSYKCVNKRQRLLSEDRTDNVGKKKETMVQQRASKNQHIRKVKRNNKEILTGSDKHTNRTAALYHAYLLIYTTIYIVRLYHTCLERCLIRVISSDFPLRQKCAAKPCVMAQL